MSQDTPVTTAIGLLGGDDDDSGGGVAQDWTPATRVEAVGPHGKVAVAQQTCVGLQEQQTAPPSMLTARHALWRGRWGDRDGEEGIVSGWRSRIRGQR
jgi:hypothetical protein